MKEQKISERIKSEQLNRLMPLFLAFSFGGVFGFIYEEIFYYIDLGYLTKRGITFGPWIPIYGFGAVFIILATNKLRKYPPAVCAVSMVVSGLLEFITGYVIYHLKGIRLWDYNVEIWNWGNIGGYVCIRSIAFFGISALFLQYVVYPIILKLQQKCNSTVFSIIAFVPALLFTLDMFISTIIYI